MFSRTAHFIKTYKLELLLFAFGILIMFRPPFDADFLWHLKYGEYLFTHGTILKENLFSYTFPQYMWANSYWLSQAISYFFVWIFGFAYGPAVQSFVLSGLMSFLIVFLLRKTQLSTAGKIVSSFFLFLIFQTFVVTVRPLYFSSVFMLVLTFVLLYRKQYIKFLPFLFLLWANMHAEFVIGLFVFGAYTLFEVINFKERHFVFKLTPTIAYLALSGLITVINPFTVNLHLTLLKESHPFQFTVISEWLPIAPDSVEMFILFLFVPMLAVVCSWNAKDKFGLWYFFTVLPLVLLALRSIYFFRPAVAVGVFGVGYYVSLLFNDFSKIFSEPQKTLFRRVFRAVAVIMLLCVAINFLMLIYVSTTPQNWIDSREYPRKAVDFIRDNALNGNVYNYYNWGSYMIWFLPEKKTFIDGRMPSWREGNHSLFEDHMLINKDPQKNIVLFKNYEQKHNIKIILVPKDHKLSNFMEKTYGWKKVFEDTVAVVLVAP